MFFFGVGVSCGILYSFVCYLYVSGSGLIISVEEERAYLSVIVYLYLCGFCWKGFLFLLVLGMGCVILLWHSPSLPYNYFQIQKLLHFKLNDAGVYDVIEKINNILETNILVWNCLLSKLQRRVSHHEFFYLDPFRPCGCISDYKILKLKCHTRN